MSWTKLNESTRTLLYCVTVVGVLVAGLIYVARLTTAEASPPANNVGLTTMAPTAPTATFPANAGTLGAVPDSPAGGTTCGDFAGAPLNVTFTVTGMTAPLSDVRVSVTSSGPVHTWVGDLDVTLRAPSDAAVKTIFKQTGEVTSTTGCGDSSDFAGAYNFFDTAPAAPTWWGAATTAGATVPVAAGNYQASTAGGGAGGGVNSPITPTFAGLTAGQINGTWTLRVHDGGAGDTGTISAASLTLTAASVPAQHVLDYNGDGRTDYTVVRNTGGGPTGQVSWFIKTAGAGTEFGRAWGIATDFFVDGNWDGDANNDVAVWRSGASGDAAFYVLRSSDSTALISVFGQSGDDPTVVEDYNNDGRTDFAVYRGGAASGDPSTWFWRSATTPAGPVNYVPWGQNGDFPAPGDYDGDGSADYVVQRNNGGGQARFWIRYAAGSTDSIVFGTPTDVIVPGDYDGDGKTDIATVRGISGTINWFYEPSGTAGVSVVQTAFGLSVSDFPAQGDYDGDGKTDIAIWRPNADPTQNFFWVLNSNGGAVSLQEWGQNGDYPVANYNTH